MIYEEVCEIPSDMCHQIREKVISDILDCIIQTVHHNMKYFKQISKKTPYMLKFAKKIETFCIHFAVKVFLETPTKGIYNKYYAKTSFQFQTKVSAKLLEFLNVNNVAFT